MVRVVVLLSFMVGCVSVPDKGCERLWYKPKAKYFYLGPCGEEMPPVKMANQ